MSPGPRKKSAPRKSPKPLPAADKTPGTARTKAVVAGPRRVGGQTPHAAQIAELERLQRLIIASLEDDKAENVVALDLIGKATFCDRMVVATGLVDRQIAVMAEHLVEKLHAAGMRRVQVEGAGGSDWVLIDAGDIVVHLFKPEARSMYALEKMWGADLDEAASG
ncbi:MAG TPA: ribosome silencing factor [Acetobacteraceae bacterium]|nr:ribosome silencing factor [Acetobacteraceae bacterium]